MQNYVIQPSRIFTTDTCASFRGSSVVVVVDDVVVVDAVVVVVVAVVVIVAVVVVVALVVVIVVVVVVSKGTVSRRDLMSSSGCRSVSSAIWSDLRSPNGSSGDSAADRRRPISITIVSFSDESGDVESG